MKNVIFEKFHLHFTKIGGGHFSKIPQNWPQPLLSSWNRNNKKNVIKKNKSHLWDVARTILGHLFFKVWFVFFYNFFVFCKILALRPVMVLDVLFCDIGNRFRELNETNFGATRFLSKSYFWQKKRCPKIGLNSIELLKTK